MGQISRITFEVPVDADSNNAYVYELTVTDADGNTATEYVTVTDAAETATISLAQTDGSVAENVAYTSQAPTLTGTPVGVVSYILAGVDAPRFTVDASTGVVSMVARDFEAPADADGINAYVYTLTMMSTAVVSEADPDKVARQALTTDTRFQVLGLADTALDDTCTGYQTGQCSNDSLRR